MDSAKLRSTILASMADLVTDLLVEDRTDDEELQRGAIETAIEEDVITVGEMLEVFADELAAQLGTVIKIDVLCGSQHRYYSTHCRHGDHEACSATVLRDEAGNAVNRKPASCKRCGSPCQCPICKANGTH
jgi:hypothetical protein